MPIAEKKDKGQFDKLASVTTESIQYFQFSFGIQSNFDIEQMWDLPIYMQFIIWWIQYSTLAGRRKISKCVFTTILENFNGFRIFVRNVTSAKCMNGSSSFYKGLWTCKELKSMDPSGRWTFRLVLGLLQKPILPFIFRSSVPLLCTALVEIGYQIFLCFIKIIKQASRVSKIPFWVTGQGCMCLILNAQPEVQILNGLYFNIYLPFPSLWSFGSAYTVVPRIASKANVLNAKKEKES